MGGRSNDCQVNLPRNFLDAGVRGYALNAGAEGVDGIDKPFEAYADQVVEESEPD